MRMEAEGPLPESDSESCGFSSKGGHVVETIVLDDSDFDEDF